MNAVRETKLEGLHLAVIAAVLLVSALLWLFYAERYLGPYIKAQWRPWFGAEWYEAGLWQSMLAFFVPSVLPAIFIGLLAAIPYRKFYYRNFATIHEVNLTELEKAKVALQQSITSVEVIATEVKGNLEKYERLKNEIEALQVARSIDKDELSKTLRAIASTSRRSVWIQRIVGFVLGIVSSLMATYIWERLNAI